MTMQCASLPIARCMGFWAEGGQGTLRSQLSTQFADRARLALFDSAVILRLGIAGVFHVMESPGARQPPP